MRPVDGERTGGFKENRWKRMTDHAGQTNPFSLRARSCLLRTNGNRMEREVTLPGKLAIFRDLTQRKGWRFALDSDAGESKFGELVSGSNFGNLSCKKILFCNENGWKGCCTGGR